MLKAVDTSLEVSLPQLTGVNDWARPVLLRNAYLQICLGSWSFNSDLAHDDCEKEELDDTTGSKPEVPHQTELEETQEHYQEGIRIILSLVRDRRLPVS